MKVYELKYLFVGLMICLNISSAFGWSKGLKVGSSQACVVNVRVMEPNSFYYCGDQSPGCAGANHSRASSDHQYYTGSDIALYDVSTDKTRYFYCCGSKWAERTEQQTLHPSWGAARKSENYTRKKTLTGGSCNQTGYDNVCGGFTVVTDCTVPDDCNEGYVLRNNACALRCSAGYGYKSSTSNDCIACKTSLRQGVDKDGMCVFCNTTEIFNAGRQSCVAFADMVQVSATAHNDCWLCGSEGAMLECFKQVTQYGSLENIAGSNAEKLKGACSLEGTNSADFHLPPDAVAIVDEEETSTGSDNASKATQ